MYKDELKHSTIRKGAINRDSFSLFDKCGCVLSQSVGSADVSIEFCKY